MANYTQVLSGSRADLQELLTGIADMDLSQDANYDWVAERMDIGNFIDYWIFNVYVDNTDWPDNNIKTWKSGAQSSTWRWIAYDTDLGYGLNDIWSGRVEEDYPKLIGGNDTLAFSASIAGNPSLIFKKLMENPGFESRFFARMEELLSGRFASQRCEDILLAMVEEARDEIQARHLPRWLDTIYYWQPNQAERNKMWQKNINIMCHFARNRPAYLRTYMAAWREKGK